MRSLRKCVLCWTPSCVPEGATCDTGSFYSWEAASLAAGHNSKFSAALTPTNSYHMAHTIV